MDLVAGLTIVLAALAGTPDGELVTIRTLVSQDPIRAGDRFSVALVLELAPGHHIYHPEQETDLVEGTRLSFVEVPGLRLLDLRFPPGHPVRNEDLDATIRELDGTVVIVADLEAAADLARGPRELEARLSYQVCTASVCKLFVTDQPHRIPLPVAAAGSPVTELHPEVFGPAAATAPPGPGPGPTAAEPGEGWLDVGGALADRGLVLALLAAFAVGVVSSLSPCVFPMIPVTVAYFGRQAGVRTRGATLRLAGFFVAGIALFFAGVGVLASVWGLDPARVLASAWVVAGLSAVLYWFAFSMLGFYEIALPSGLVSRIGGGREGGLGALGMGLALAPVALPCVGPFAGALLVLVFQRQDPLFGAAFMGVYGAGLGALFLALALGIASLPRAGAWMASLKRAFGVVVLWLPVWFVSNLLEPGSPGTLVLAGLTSCVSGSFLGAFRPLEAETRPGVLLGRGLGVPLVVGGAWL
ncbi:MAG: hypothetical protein HY722_07025, partial [Planctomycetes bacterium]|nr:hypothetical protein [Planctomycetota bacterium]